MAAAVLILGFVALFSVGGGANPSATAGFPTTTTTTIARSSATTSTTFITLKGGLGPNGTKRQDLVLVAVPNLVGLTLAQADSVLAAFGLSSEISTPTTATAGTSSTGTILAQDPAPGSRTYQSEVIQLSVSGY
jgi:hypothetical protein